MGIGLKLETKGSWYQKKTKSFERFITSEMSLKNVPLLFFFWVLQGCSISVHLSFPFVYLFTPSFPFSLLLLVGILLLWRKQWVLSRFFLCIDARESLRNSKHRLIAPTPFCLFFTLFTYQIVDMLNMHTNIVIVLQLERQGEVWERDREVFRGREWRTHMQLLDECVFHAMPPCR